VYGHAQEKCGIRCHRGSANRDGGIPDHPRAHRHHQLQLGPGQLGRDLNIVFGRANNPINLIAAIVELIAGVIVLAAVFFYLQSRWIFVATLVIAILGR